MGIALCRVETGKRLFAPTRRTSSRGTIKRCGWLGSFSDRIYLKVSFVKIQAKGRIAGGNLSTRNRGDYFQEASPAWMTKCFLDVHASISREAFLQFGKVRKSIYGALAC